MGNIRQRENKAQNWCKDVKGGRRLTQTLDNKLELSIKVKLAKIHKPWRSSVDDTPTR